MIAAAGRRDAGAFLARLLRFDPAAVVRLRPGRGTDPLVEIWARLPFEVLVTRRLASTVDADRTVEAAALLAALGAPDEPTRGWASVRRRDEAWLWPLPPSRGVVVETIPAAEIVRVAAAAARTLREAAESGVDGRSVGQRALRDALLDHIPIVITGTGDEPVRVPQRMVQAAVRMGFVGSVRTTESVGAASTTTIEGSMSMTLSDNLVTVRLAAGWIGLDASYGSVWYRPSSPLQFR